MARVTGSNDEQQIENHHSVARHLANRDIDGGVLGSAAFLLTEGHDYVSVFHMEYFAAPAQPEQLACVCAHLEIASKSKLAGARKVAPSNKFALLNVAEAKHAVEVATEKRVALNVEKHRLDGAPFHAGLFGYGMNADGNLAAIALKQVAVLSPEKRALPSIDSCNCTKR